MSLKYNEEKIENEINKYTNLDKFMFYYYLGIAYYNNKKYEKSLLWYNKAMKINR